MMEPTSQPFTTAPETAPAAPVLTNEQMKLMLHHLRPGPGKSFLTHILRRKGAKGVEEAINRLVPYAQMQGMSVELPATEFAPLNVIIDEGEKTLSHHAYHLSSEASALAVRARMTHEELEILKKLPQTRRDVLLDGLFRLAGGGMVTHGILRERTPEPPKQGAKPQPGGNSGDAILEIAAGIGVALTPELADFCKRMESINDALCAVATQLEQQQRSK